MRIIFIAEFGHYKKWGPKNYFDLINHVSKHSTHDILIYYSDDEDDIENRITRKKPDMVVFFETNTFGNTMLKFDFIFKLNIPTAIALLDMFYPSLIINNEYMKKIDCIIHFGHQKKLIEYYQKQFPNKLITSFKSRFINKKRFQNYKYKKEYDIIFYGTRRYFHNFKNENLPIINDYIKKYEKHSHKKLPDEINFYPLRERLENLLSNNKKYKVLTLPEKNSYESKIKNEKLSQLLNKSRMAVACSTIADICMHKFLEIGGSYCLILGDIPTDYQSFFKDKICEVNQFMSDDEILNKIDSFLDNKKKLEETTKRLYNDIHKNYSFDEAVKDFDKIFDEITNYMKNKK